MGSMTEMFKYKASDNYLEHDIRHGKHDNEIGEFIWKFGVKEYRYCAIYPNRPFCFVTAFSAMGASAACCIVEIKHSISEGIIKEMETPLWIVQGAMNQKR